MYEPACVFLGSHHKLKTCPSPLTPYFVFCHGPGLIPRMLLRIHYGLNHTIDLNIRRGYGCDFFCNAYITEMFGDKVNRYHIWVVYRNVTLSKDWVRLMGSAALRHSLIKSHRSSHIDLNARLYVVGWNLFGIFEDAVYNPPNRANR